ncbi:hypothetical protein PoB_002082800 [Plakobranchus ocellatus]|uniref:Uncharacterized protein n=1 Tax=Plakobranchus ocellatus TaxID=259542 RepID=A0AAV3ZHN4_9GAST|nr:hypothetical protein PoB_002082800 [Plakobranchus ocellatus]
MPKKRFQRQRKHLIKARAQRQQAGEVESTPNQPEASPQPAPEQPVPEEPAQEQPGQESLPSTSRGPHTSSPSTKRIYIPLSTPPPASPIAEKPILTRSEQKLALSQWQQVQPTDVKRTIVELPQLAKLLGDLRCHACLSEQGLSLRSQSGMDWQCKQKQCAQPATPHCPASSRQQGTLYPQVVPSLSLPTRRPSCQEWAPTR